MAGLTDRISQLENQYISSPSSVILKEYLLLKSDFDTLSTAVTEEMLIKSRHAFYEYGEKANRLLAHQLRQSSASHIIPAIKTHNTLLSDHREINNSFLEFYRLLYSSEQTSGYEDFHNFFKDFSLPHVKTDAMQFLDGPISLDEVCDAISAMQCGKSPGPDGFPAEFLKKFSGQVAPLLLNMYNESFDQACLPQTLREASISLILKKDKDPHMCSSYRPISLLNVDVKILAKILASRLETVLPNIISTDQTGFIKNRFSFFNVRRLLNILYHPMSSSTPEVLISLDAEKAFDRVEWDYLFHTLEMFGFGANFISWVKLLYKVPLASVHTNNISSAYFQINRGTRQGCPLSPLLFAVAIEPLAIALRQNSKIAGIIRGGQEHKVSLYADDLILYISDPSNSLPHVLKIFDIFRKLSGYKLNLQKSEMFPINNAARELPTTSFPFKVSHSFTYLGIHIPNSFSKLFAENFPRLLERVEQDLKRWARLPLSVAGRINSIKMNVLPKFTYLFQCIPVFIPNSFFRKLDSALGSFIWNGKPARIRKSLLQRPKSLGGMSLPNFQCYYWASNIRPILHWLYEDPGADALSWIAIESASCLPSSLAALVYAPLSFPCENFIKNSLVRSTIKIWKQMRRHFGWQTMSPKSPINSNHVFNPSIIDKSFKSWNAKGIRVINDLYYEGVFCSFQQMCEQFHIPKNHFFRYLQIRDFVRKMFPQFPAPPPCSPYDHILEDPLRWKGIVSILYCKILAPLHISLSQIKAWWEEDLEIVISDEDWEAALYRIHKSSVCARHGLLQCKIVHRVHWTKLKLSKHFQDVDPACDRCRFSPASHAHMFWSCTKLRGFWSIIFETLSGFLGKSISPCPLIALFGITPASYNFTKIQSDCIAFIMLLAKRLILLKWKDRKPPTPTQWIRDVLFFLKLEKIKHSLRGSSSQFHKAWNPFKQYVREQVSLSDID